MLILSCHGDCETNILPFLKKLKRTEIDRWTAPCLGYVGSKNISDPVVRVFR